MDIHRRLQGKRIAEVLTNGHLLSIRTLEGDEVIIAWLDDNGKPLKGKPAVAQSGARIQVAGLRELAHLPQIRTRGEA